MSNPICAFRAKLFKSERFDNIEYLHFRQPVNGQEDMVSLAADTTLILQISEDAFKWKMKPGIHYRMTVEEWPEGLP